MSHRHPVRPPRRPQVLPNPGRTKCALLAGATLLLLAGGGAQALAQQQPVRAEPPSLPAAGGAGLPQNYALQANDLVEVLVFQEDDLHARLRIAKDGTINLPLIGTVSTAKRTTDEVAATIRRQLADGYLADPQVTVTVLAYAKRRFTVLGQVNRPGSYDMPDNSTISLVQAVGLAGGYSRAAAPKRVLIKRIVNGQEVVQRVDAERMARGVATGSFDVLPGDTITVPESIF